MKDKVAIFKDPQSTCTVIYTPDTSRYTGWVRITEWVPVDFTDRMDSAEQIAEAVARIDAEIEKTAEAHMEKLKALKARKTAVLSKVFESA